MSIETLRTFLGWSALLNLIWLTFLFFVFMLGKEWIYRLHSHWFSLSREAMDSIIYAAMAWYKLATFLFFVMPYLVLRFFIA